jgi:hypothetical protein
VRYSTIIVTKDKDLSPRLTAEQRDELAPFQLIELHSLPPARIGLQDIELAANSQRVSACVPTILATKCAGQNITRYLGQTKYVVEFAISQQPSIGGHQGATKLEHQAAVEIQPHSIRSRFTPWVRHSRLARSRVRCRYI